MLKVVIHTDGASRGNPGQASIAYTIEGITDESVEFAVKIGQTSNNQAEYQALVAALEKTLELVSEPALVTCFSDSELMVKQLNGEYRVKDGLLRPHYEKILELAKALKSLGGITEFVAIRREKNKRADQLANLALDGKLG
jgi:ribonuclease HI